MSPIVFTRIQRLSLSYITCFIYHKVLHTVYAFTIDPGTSFRSSPPIQSNAIPGVDIIFLQIILFGMCDENCYWFVLIGARDRIEVNPRHRHHRVRTCILSKIGFLFML